MVLIIWERKKTLKSLESKQDYYFRKDNAFPKCTVKNGTTKMVQQEKNDLNS